MYRIAILGCENSHADAFLNTIIKEKKYPDIEVVGVYSNEPEALERMKKNFGVFCADSYDAFVGRVDGIMITARDGRNHYKYAKPYIPYGIPMFIDKPITSDNEEALAFARELVANGCRVCGGSTCTNAPLVKELSEKLSADECGNVYGGFLRAPVSMTNNYGGFFFYAQHLVEVMMKIFGYYPISVRACQNKNVISLTVRYEKYDVLAEFVDGDYGYFAYVSSSEGMLGGKYEVTEQLYPCELADFYDILTGAPSKHDMRDFIAPVYLMSAIARSVANGGEVLLDKVGDI